MKGIPTLLMVKRVVVLIMLLTVLLFDNSF